MNSKIKVAIIGGGINSAVGKAHISAILLSNLYQITTVFFSRDKEINELSRDKYNLNESIICYELDDVILQKENYNAVIVLTPTDTHFEILIRLITENIHVICEKALVSTLDQANILKENLTKSNSKLYVIYNYLGYTMVKSLKKIIQEGELGQVHSIQVEMPQEGFARKQFDKPISIQSWRLDDGFIPTLSLDLGVHLHILIYYLLNIKPLNVFAIYNNNGNYKQIVSDVNALLTYENSIVCNMWFSKTAIGYLNGLKIRIFGSDASAEWVQIDPDKLIMSYADGSKTIIDKNNNLIQEFNLSEYDRFKPGHPTGFIEALSNYYIDIYSAYNGENINSQIEVFGIDESISGIEFLYLFSKSVIEGKMISFV
jgi:predicted dehydrogenase